MAWIIVASIAFGLYGSLINPVIGLIGFVAPITIHIIRKRDLEVSREEDIARQERDEAQECWRNDRDLLDLQNRLRERLNAKMHEVQQTFQLTVKSSPMGVLDYRSFDREVLRFLNAGAEVADLNICHNNGTSIREIYEQSISADLHKNIEISRSTRSC